MQENARKTTRCHIRELAWLLIILFVATVLRVIRLGQMPFNAVDASLAADALAMSNNAFSGQSALAAYTGITGVLFYLTNSTNIIARFLPVLAGISIVVLSFLIVNRLDMRVAVLFSLGLALDPFMLMLSRQIMTPMITLAGLGWGVYAFQHKKYILAGCLSAVAMLGGYYFWVIALFILLMWALSKLIKFQLISPIEGVIEKKDFFTVVVSFLMSSILVSTSFLLAPSGLGQIGSGFVDFLNLFTQPYQLPIYHFVFLLLRYAFLPLIAGIIWLSTKSSALGPGQKRIAGLYFLMSILFVLFFSRKETGLIVFFVIPLWYFAARWIAYIRIDLSSKPAIKIASLTFYVVLFVYIMMSLFRLVHIENGSPLSFQAGLSVLAGILLVLILFWMSSLSIDVKNSSRILAVSVLMVFFVATFSISFNSLKETNDSSQLMVNVAPILLSSEDQLTALNPFQDYGLINFSETSFSAEDSQYDLQWFIRDFKPAESSKTPEFILSTAENMPNYEVPYRGMKIELARSIPWLQLDFKNYLYNILNPQSSLQLEYSHLWVQTKLFTGAIQ